MIQFDNIKNIIKRLIKYIIEGVIVVLVARWLPNTNISWKNALTIALTVSTTFAILDYFTPELSLTTRSSVDFSIGDKLGELLKNIY